MDDKNARNMQHPIPQNFMDVEFKIIGDLTMRQFVYLCAFGGPAYLMYTSPFNPFLKWPLVLIFGGLAIVLTSVPIDDRGADEWIVNFIRAIYGVNQRVYKKRGEVPKVFSMKSVEFIQAGVIATTSTSNRRKVEEYIKGISKVEEKPDMNDFNFSSRRFVETPISPTATALIQREQEIKSTTEAATVEKAYEEVVLASPFSREAQPEIKKFEIKKPMVTPVLAKIIPQKLKSFGKRVGDTQDQLRTSSASTPGRKFISFSKKEAEELILPIRGEKAINIFDTTPIIESAAAKKDIKVIAKELEAVTKEAKKTYGIESFGRSLNFNEDQKQNFVEGVILNPQNQPLTNINIQISNKQGEVIETTTTTNEGKFNFYNLLPGDYQLKILNPYLYQLNFDIINFSVQNFPYPQIKIVGKQ